MKVKLGELINVKTGKLDANAANENGLYPFFTCSKEPLRINTYTYDCECVLVAGNGDLNVKYYKGKFDAYQRTYILESSSNKLYMPYLYFFMDKYVDTLRKQSIGGVIKYIKLENITNASLELIDINKQKEICNKIYKVKELIDKQKKIIDYFDTLIKARFVEMFGDISINSKGYNTKRLDTVCKFNKCNDDIKEKNNKVWLLNLDAIESNSGNIIEYEYVDKDEIPTSTIKFNENSVLYSKLRPYLNKVVIPNQSGYGTSELIVLEPDKNINQLYLAETLRNEVFVSFINGTSYGAKMPRASIEALKNYNIIVPPIELQNDFAAFVQHIDKLKFDVQKSLEKTQMLFDSMMQEYFG